LIRTIDKNLCTLYYEGALAIRLFVVAETEETSLSLHLPRLHFSAAFLGLIMRRFIRGPSLVCRFMRNLSVRFKQDAELDWSNEYGKGLEHVKQ
jgi:hypothetical protein